MSDAVIENQGEPLQDQPPVGDEAARRRKPKRNSLLRSVISNWIWYSVVVVSGFILPRMIDRYQDQTMLGIWDFGWSMVFYVRWLQVGVSGAINRYVARFVAAEDYTALNQMVNSAMAMLTVSTVLGLLAGVGFSLAVPYMLDVPPHQVRLAQLVVFMLATATLAEMAGSALNSVIAGCDRFDLLNLIRGIRECVTLGLMVAVLLTGGTVLGLAIVMFGTAVVLDIVYAIAGKRLLPQLEYSPRHFCWKYVRITFDFMAKGIAAQMSRGLLYQINSVLVASFLGPAALAVYARQRSLLLHITSVVKQYAYVLIPKSSALDAKGDLEALRDLMIRAARYGWYITLPLVLITMIQGTPLVTLWMGPDFVAPAVLITMSLGHVFSTSQNSVYTILMGQGRHGVPAVVSLVSAVVSIALGYTALRMGGGMVWAAVAMGVSLTLSDGLFMPIYACRCVGLSIAKYYVESMRGPLLAGIPFALCLLAVRVVCGEHYLMSVLIGLPLGGLVLAPIYWRVFPESGRRAILKRLGIKPAPSIVVLGGPAKNEQV